MEATTLVVVIVLVIVAVLGSAVVIFAKSLCNTIKTKRIYELLAREYGEHEGVLLEWLCFEDYGQSDSRFQQAFFCRNLEKLLSQIKAQSFRKIFAGISFKPYCQLPDKLVTTLGEAHYHFFPVNPEIGGRKAWLQASLETVDLDGNQSSKVIRVLAMTNTDEDILKKLGLI